MTSGDVEAHSAHLEKRVLPNEDNVKKFLIDHLRSAGYDISSLYTQ
jgi:predicted type IV restriction endonuclease